MTPSGPDPATVVGVGLTALLALGAALWKAVGLRGDMNKAWSKRVDAAVSSLTDRAIDELRALRRDTDHLLGGPEEEDPPILATVDPTPLVRRAKDLARYYENRRRLDKHFKRVLRVAPLLVPSLLTLAASTVTLTLYYANIAHYEGVRIAGLICLLLGTASGGFLFAVYLIAQQRLSGAELLGDRPPPDDEDV